VGIKMERRIISDKSTEVLQRISSTWYRLLDHVYNQLFMARTTNEVDKEDLLQIRKTIQDTYKIFNRLLIKNELNGDKAIFDEQTLFLSDSFNVLARYYSVRDLDDLMRLMQKYNRISKLRFSFNTRRIEKSQTRN
jgi:hypothetical protein